MTQEQFEEQYSDTESCAYWTEWEEIDEDMYDGELCECGRYDDQHVHK